MRRSCTGKRRRRWRRARRLCLPGRRRPASVSGSGGAGRLTDHENSCGGG